MRLHKALPVEAEGYVGQDSAAGVVGEEGVQGLAGDAQRRYGPPVRALLPQGGCPVSLRPLGEPCGYN